VTAGQAPEHPSANKVSQHRKIKPHTSLRAALRGRQGYVL
jgi:hypothetical protein